MSFDFKNTIEDIWNAQVYSQVNDRYIVKNVNWNADIPAGESIQFGFSGNEAFEELPQECQLIIDSKNVAENNYAFEYKIDGDWGSGFTATIIITNNTEAVIEDWSLEFDFDNDISSIWNGVIAAHEGNHYVIHNADYNQNIAPNESVAIGFTVASGDSSNTVTDILLKQINVKTEEEPESETEKVDIGEAYFKRPASEDILLNKETGIMYVKDQILISALMGVPKEVVVMLAEELEADIVGYIELSNDYQLEFREEKTAEELDDAVDYLNGFSYISLASLNTAVHSESSKTQTDDTEYAGDVWSEEAPANNNWGLEALKIPSAWDFHMNFQPVKVGLIDDMFDVEHPDLKEQFVTAFNNPEVIDKSHGTHVAGIMAATWNNTTGIAGVVTEAEIYGYATLDQVLSIMEYKYAFALLIGNNVKVINISQHTGELQNFAASRGNEQAIRYVEANAAIIEEFLGKLILYGYDFVIVVAAGNVEDDCFVADNSADYGYIKVEQNNAGTYEDKNGNQYLSTEIEQGNVTAYYNNFLNAIDAYIVQSRIIVVGAIADKMDKWKRVYECADFSNVGERVDVCAPGQSIWSCVPVGVSNSGYDTKKGTSMAAPYIAGIAGMLYQANPQLSGTQIKNIISKDANARVMIATQGYSYNMPDASLCVQEAVNTEGGNTDYVLPSGTLVGKVVSGIMGKPVSEVKVTAYRTSAGESNLGDHYTTDRTDVNGNYELILEQGTYDLYVHADGYMPFIIHDVVIEPEEILYWEDIKLHSWGIFVSTYADVTGHIVDALNGTSIEGATVKLRSGWNNTNGNYVVDIWGKERTDITNLQGQFSFHLPIGAYTAEISKDGYITGYCNLIASIDAGTGTQTFVLTPVLSEDEYRIVLTWGSAPNDLDSHLTYYVGSVQQMHVYFGNKTGWYDGEVVASLDLDDTSAFGPETVTLTLDTSLIENGVFKYSVHKYSSSGTFALADAVVRVYRGNTLLETYNAPENTTNNVWHVFDIEKSGIVSYNDFYTSSASQVR